MNSEAKLLTAICKNKDMASILNQNIDNLFTSYGDVWRFVKNYWAEYKSVPDVSTVEEKFFDFDPVPNVSGDTKFYLDELREYYVGTQLSHLLRSKSHELKQGSPIEVLKNLTAEATKLNNVSATTHDMDITDYEQRAEHMEQVAQMNRDGFGTIGVPTQINAIDSIYGGLQPSDYIIIMGWTGSLKTWLATLMACRAWDAGFKPMIMSLEMTPEQMGARIDTILGMGEFSNKALMNGQIDFDNYREWGKSRFKDKQGFTVVSREGMREVTPDMVHAKIEQHRPDLVICDYHQLFADGRGTMDQTRKNLNVANDFMSIAGAAQVPLIDITAVTMDGDHGERPPLLNEVAWAKQIAYNADLTLAVCSQYDKFENKYLLEAVARKTRRSEPFSFSLDWDIDAGVVKETYYDEQEEDDEYEYEEDSQF